MKTYKFVAIIVMAFGFVSCEKSSGEIPEELTYSSKGDYTVILKSNNELKATILGDSKEGLVVQSEAIGFKEIPDNAFKFRTSEEISFYYTSSCQAFIQLYDATDDDRTVFSVFEDVNPCDIYVTAIAHTDDEIFVSYERELVGKDKLYMIRSISIASKGSEISDIELNKKPIDLMPSSGRLFVMTKNEFITDEFHLSVIDLDSKESLIELDLGNDATKLFKNKEEQIIIGYPELHTTLNPITLDKSYTTYGNYTSPGFINTSNTYIDVKGIFYFQKTVESSSVTTVPASYDFKKNSTVVYLYENFLSETELNVKYSIASTTAIGFDDDNGFILIGYQKKGQSEKGGMLRISPAPDFKIIDNIDLEGIPQNIFVQ